MADDTPAANLTFLPWLRQGTVAAIADADRFVANQRAVASLSVAIGVKDDTGPALGVTVRLRGPADVVGIDAQQVVRTEPRPGSQDFEPNYFPGIEFDRPDFPWLFTPLKANDASRLRPWLCLVVVRKQDGVTLTSTADAPLPALQIAGPAKPALELPDLVDSWAWAHAQVASGDSTEATVRAALDGAPHKARSRLLCPRILAPDTDYLACVVPTFELGRKAGLGLPIADTELTSDVALAPAWSFTPSPPSQVFLPVFHQWEFRTGAGGDFESLARQLVALPAPDTLGKRPVDVSRPGFQDRTQPQTPADFPAGSILPVEGALQSIDEPDALAPWPAGLQAPFQQSLAAIVDAPAALAATTADPLLAPPLYGRWYAARATVAPAGPGWFDQVNLDPRLRSVAAYGTRVVQENQEALMASAWEQAGEALQANQKLRRLQLSLAVSTRLHARHFVPLASGEDVGGLLRVTAPAFGRLRAPLTPDRPTPGTMVAHLEVRALSVQTLSAPMRSIARPRGPLTRRCAAQGVERSTLPNWVVLLSRPTPILRTRTFGSPGLATVDALNLHLGQPIHPWKDTTALVVGNPRVTGAFAISAEGQPVAVRTLGTPVNVAATAFQNAAVEHLQRVNPGRLRVPPLMFPMDAQAIASTVIAQTQPRRTLVALAGAIVGIDGTSAQPPTGTPASDTVGIGVVSLEPDFPRPMYEPLRDLSQDLLLPGLGDVLPNSMLGLRANHRFIETYLLGLNVEMAGEFAWRGFPADARGTWFRRFWDATAAPATPGDIRELRLWGEQPIGGNAPGSSAEQFVTLLRSPLLMRYPNALIAAVAAKRATIDGIDTRQPDPDAQDLLPAFHGSMQPDVSFFGFDLTPDQVTGKLDGVGHYVVIQEHPTEPRFGLDVGTPTGNATHLKLSSPPPEVLGAQWPTNSARIAGLLRQPPVRIAIHGSKFVAPPSHP